MFKTRCDRDIISTLNVGYKVLLYVSGGVLAHSDNATAIYCSPPPNIKYVTTLNTLAMIFGKGLIRSLERFSNKTQ